MLRVQGADVHRVEALLAGEHPLHVGIDGRPAPLKRGELSGPLSRLLLHQVATGHHLNIVHPGLG